jgi:S1-C subfamily serine protease
VDEAVSVGAEVSSTSSVEELVRALEGRRNELLGTFEKVSDVYPQRFIERVYDRRIESALREASGLPPFVTESGFPTYLLPQVEENLDRWRQSVVSLAWSGSGTGLTAVSGVIIGENTIVAEANGISTQLGTVGTESAPLPSMVNVTFLDGTTAQAVPQGIVRVGYDYWAVMESAQELPFPPLPIDANANLAIGEPVVAIGHPGTVGRWVGTLGVVEESYLIVDPEDPEAVIPTITSTNPYWLGMQGGALVTPDGELVALVVYAFLREGMTTGGPGGTAPSPVPDFLFPESPYISQDLVMQSVDIGAVIEALEVNGYF